MLLLGFSMPVLFFFEQFVLPFGELLPFGIRSLLNIFFDATRIASQSGSVGVRTYIHIMQNHIMVPLAGFCWVWGWLDLVWQQLFGIFHFPSFLRSLLFAFCFGLEFYVLYIFSPRCHNAYLPYTSWITVAVIGLKSIPDITAARARKKPKNVR